MGVLHWSPAAFWNATVYDAFRARKGWMRANGHDKGAGEKRTSLSAADAFELKQRANRARRADLARNHKTR